MDNRQTLRHRLIRYLAGGGALLMLIGFFLFPWATNSLSTALGGGQSATGIQMLWGELFSSPMLRQIDIVKSTPGLWLLIIPAIAILVLAGFFILDRLHKWHRTYWLAVVVAALASVCPLLRLLTNDTIWVLLGDMAFSYHPRSSSGFGFFVTLTGISVLIVGAVGGIVGKNSSPVQD